MKKVIPIALMTIMLFSLAGCGATKPEATVGKFFTAAKTIDTETMASTIVPSNTQGIMEIKNVLKNNQRDLPIAVETTQGIHEIKEVSTYNQSDLPTAITDYLKTNAGKMSYKVIGSEINGDKAAVTVKCKYVEGEPLFRTIFSAYIVKAMQFSYDETQLTQERTNHMLAEIMKEQILLSSETIKEITLKVNCVKQDNAWYISEVTDDMKDVVVSDFVTVANEYNNSISSTKTTMMEKAKKDNMTIINKTVGDEVVLAMLKLKVNSVEEKSEINSINVLSTTTIENGAKFVVINLEATNIANSAFALFPSDLIIVDNQNREFKGVYDTFESIDNPIVNRNLSPGVKETGYLVYTLPGDATSYKLTVSKTDTNDLYMIQLK